jgi:hypothetical protein
MEVLNHHQYASQERDEVISQSTPNQADPTYYAWQWGDAL